MSEADALHDTRSEDRRRHHYEVEKRLADQIRNSTRETRPALFERLYGQLFTEVPDHPRLTRRDTPEMNAAAVRSRMRVLADTLGPEKILLEFAPGDCALAYHAAKSCKEVIGADISDQRNPETPAPHNFRLIVYDGYTIDLPDSAVDVAFSYQMLEHLHPEDILQHLETACRLVKPGGLYVFDTPHRFSGPHDVSRFYSDVPQGFHMHEYTYSELRSLLKKAGFSKVWCIRFGKVQRSALFNSVTLALEWLMGLLPRRLQRKLSPRFFQGVTIAAQR